MVKKSTTALSLANLRSRGYLPTVVESYNHAIQRKKDLFGFIDIVALHPDRTGLLGVQTTSAPNLLARVRKAEGILEYEVWLACGNAVEFHGWTKDGSLKLLSFG